MKSSIKQKYQDFINYIEFPTLIYTYETDRLLAINQCAKNIIGETTKAMSLLWGDKKKIKFPKNVLASGTEILYNKTILVNKEKVDVDIEFNSIWVGKGYLILCFFELSTKQCFEKQLSYQVPRFYSKDEELIFQGGNQYYKIDMNEMEQNDEYVCNDSNFELVGSLKNREDELDVIKNNRNVYNVIQAMQTSKSQSIFIKLHRMPIIDRSEDNYGMICVYHILLSKEERKRILNDIVNENLMLNNYINKSNMILMKIIEEEGYPIKYISQSITKYGYSPNDFYNGKIKLKDIVHPDDYSKLFEEGDYCKEKISVNSYRIRTKDKKVIWIQDKAIEIGEVNGIAYRESIIIETI